MSSSRTSEREEERRFNLRTLAIASAASATAAVVTSQLWIAGTWIAAALTPVLVALISELLHRPTEKIAERWTADRPALRRPREEPAEAAPREPEPAREAEPAGEPERAPVPAGPGPVRVYRSGGPSRARRRVAVGAVLGTGALALVIAVFALTVPELIAGGAIGGGKDRRSTFFPRDRSASEDDQKRAPATQTDGSETPTASTTEQPADEPPATQPPSDTAPATTPTTTAPQLTETTPAPQAGEP